MHFAIQNLMLHTHITVQIALCKQTADKILITAKYIGSILRKHLHRLFVVLHFIMKKYIQHGICLLYILCLCIARIIFSFIIVEFSFHAEKKKFIVWRSENLFCGKQAVFQL